jgi:RimJ/RimL family protein N-acetyltransferase
VLRLKKTKREELTELCKISVQKHAVNNLNPKSLEQFQNEFTDKSTIWLSVMSNDKVVGYAILVDKYKSSKIQLKRIVLEEGSLGNGKRVLELIEKYCLQELDKYTLWLDVYANNTRAIHLYEKLKFVRYSHGMENEREVFFMRKN